MKQAQLKGKLIAAIRVRGKVNVRKDTAETLERLRLKNVNNCTLIKVNDQYLGMLKKCVNEIAYGEIDEPTLGKLVAKYALNADPVGLINGKADAAQLKELMPLRLHPPKHGFRGGIRKHFNQGGNLGYMGTEINALLQRMV